MPEFTFKLSSRAAKKNYMVLGKYNFSLASALEAQKDSPLGYGSEFRKSNILHQLLHKHRLWPRLNSLLNHGSTYPLEPLSEEDRIEDLALALEFQNHKGAMRQPQMYSPTSAQKTSFLDMDLYSHST